MHQFSSTWDSTLCSRKEETLSRERVVSRLSHQKHQHNLPKRPKGDSTRLEVVLEDDTTRLANSLWQQVGLNGSKVAYTMSCSSIESTVPFSPRDFDVPVPSGFLEAVAAYPPCTTTHPTSLSSCGAASEISQRQQDALKPCSSDLSQPMLRDLLANHQLRHLMGLGTQTQRDTLQFLSNTESGGATLGSVAKCTDESAASASAAGSGDGPLDGAISLTSSTNLTVLDSRSSLATRPHNARLRCSPVGLWRAPLFDRLPPSPFNTFLERDCVPTPDPTADEPVPSETSSGGSRNKALCEAGLALTSSPLAKELFHDRFHRHGLDSTMTHPTRPTRALVPRLPCGGGGGGTLNAISSDPSSVSGSSTQSFFSLRTSATSGTVPQQCRQYELTNRRGHPSHAYADGQMQPQRAAAVAAVTNTKIKTVQSRRHGIPCHYRDGELSSEASSHVLHEATTRVSSLHATSSPLSKAHRNVGIKVDRQSTSVPHVGSSKQGEEFFRELRALMRRDLPSSRSSVFHEHRPEHTPPSEHARHFTVKTTRRVAPLSRKDGVLQSRRPDLTLKQLKLQRGDGRQNCTKPDDHHRTCRSEESSKVRAAAAAASTVHYASSAQQPPAEVPQASPYAVASPRLTALRAAVVETLPLVTEASPRAAQPRSDGGRPAMLSAFQHYTAVRGMPSTTALPCSINAGYISTTVEPVPTHLTSTATVLRRPQQPLNVPPLTPLLDIPRIYATRRRQSTGRSTASGKDRNSIPADGSSSPVPQEQHQDGAAFYGQKSFRAEDKCDTARTLPPLSSARCHTTKTTARHKKPESPRCLFSARGALTARGGSPPPLTARTSRLSLPRFPKWRR